MAWQSTVAKPTPQNPEGQILREARPRLTPVSLSLSVCVFVCVCVCVCMNACMHACMDVCIYVCMYGCMDVCVYVCLYEDQGTERAAFAGRIC